MDLFKTQIDRIQKQLAGLTPSQRMLTAALVAIMVMTLVWWGHYAGEPEMEPLLPQAISADELPRVLSELDAKGIKHAMSGDRVLVPSDRRVEALAGLMYSHALPRSAKEGFDEVLKNINPLSSQSSNDEIWNKAKEGMAAQLIRDFPGVADAQVMMDPHQVVRIVGGIDSSASVAIKMQPGSKSTSQLVDAAADVVQGALSSLSRRNIRVVVDGIPRRPHLETDPTNDPGDQLEMVKAAETHLEEKVQKQLHYMPGMTVSVTVHLNTSREHLNSTTFDAKGVVSKETEIKQKTDENTPAVANPAGEPGVAANLNAADANGPSSLGGNGSGAASSNHEETETKIQNSIPKTDIDRVTPPGDTTPLSAAVSIPLSYFANIYTHENLNLSVKDPTETQMQSLIDRKLPELRRLVASCIGLKLDTDVAIETYLDPAPAMEAAVPAATAGLSVSMLAGGHVKEIALAGLAMVSLFMVSMVVRKGAAPAIAVAMPAGPRRGDPRLRRSPSRRSRRGRLPPRRGRTRRRRRPRPTNARPGDNDGKGKSRKRGDARETLAEPHINAECRMLPKCRMQSAECRVGSGRSHCNDGRGQQRGPLWHRTKRFALDVIRLYVELPKTGEAQVIGRQMIRSGTSPGSHYREACRARSVAEFVSKMSGGLQELEETGYWFELLVEAGIVPVARLAKLRPEANELTAMFVSSINTARKGQR